jgi:hydroxymethylbilane synthase
MPNAPRLRLGTRGSQLARWQADWVAARLTALGVEVEMVEIATQGDVRQVGPIANIGTLGVFTKEIQRALLDGQIDLAVHSLKDLPTEPVPGLSLAAAPPREACGDALIAREAKSFDDLPRGAVIGTGSLRRQAQLLAARPDLKMADIRGNVETRLKKLEAGDYDAIVLAEAGLRRLQLTAHITQVLPKSIILPAIGQGALGVEARDDDPFTREILARLDDADTHRAVAAERALLYTLRGGCMAPVGAWGRVEDGRLALSAVVLSPDGKQKLECSAAADPAEAEQLGRQVAEQLLAQGAAELIRQGRA